MRQHVMLVITKSITRDANGRWYTAYNTAMPRHDATITKRIPQNAMLRITTCAAVCTSKSVCTHHSTTTTTVATRAHTHRRALLLLLFLLLLLLALQLHYMPFTRTLLQSTPLKNGCALTAAAPPLMLPSLSAGSHFSNCLTKSLATALFAPQLLRKACIVAAVSVYASTQI
jgi:hypothetical protein